MSEIIEVHARQILDSRGNPTLEVDVTLESGAMGRAAVPSGASTGSREAVELRDKNPKVYMGKGVSKAIKNVNSKIAAEIIGIEVTEQVLIDRLMIEMDGTANKSNLGFLWRWPRRRQMILTCPCFSISEVLTPKSFQFP